jgi:uncharacterized protein
MKVALALCGGGVRGLVTASMMMRPDIQKIIGTPDLIAGTSTGGLIALMLSIGRSPAQILDAYHRFIPIIFSRPWWRRGLSMSKYPADGIEKAAREMFGARTMHACHTPVLAVACSLAYRRVKVFKSWTDGDEWIADVARATSAAPTYFPPSDSGLVDGGVWANNPSVCAAAEMARLWPGEPHRVVCLGTGQSIAHIRPADAAGWGLVRWAPRIVDVLMDAGMPGVSYQMSALLGDRYIEINPDLGDLDPAMDRTDPDHLKALIELGQTWQI